MGLVTLPNLYTSPQDIFDLLGVAGTQLRLDDVPEATGQRVTVTADAAAGGTSLAVAPLLYPLLRGTTLEFVGAGDAAVVEAILTAVGQVGDTSLSVVALPAAVNATAAARDYGVNLATAARLVKGCSYGTAECKRRLCIKYQDSDLATCWSVNRWATAEGALWVCRRRGNSPPASVKDEADEARKAMSDVQRGVTYLEDIGTRTPAWPWISNVTVDLRYTVAKVRSEPVISEESPTLYAQFVDWQSIFSLEGVFSFF